MLLKLTLVSAAVAFASFVTAERTKRVDCGGGNFASDEAVSFFPNL